MNTPGRPYLRYIQHVGALALGMFLSLQVDLVNCMIAKVLKKTFTSLIHNLLDHQVQSTHIT